MKYNKNPQSLNHDSLFRVLVATCGCVKDNADLKCFCHRRKSCCTALETGALGSQSACVCVCVCVLSCVSPSRLSAELWCLPREKPQRLSVCERVRA